MPARVLRVAREVELPVTVLTWYLAEVEMRPVAEMANLNRTAAVQESVRDLVIIATNAGGEGLGSIGERQCSFRSR